MELKYSTEKEKTSSVKAMGRDLNISFKNAVELCKFVKGRTIPKALTLLEDVIEKKRHVPYTRFKTGIGHRKGDTDKIGKYPVKAAQKVLEIVRNLEVNAEYKGLDPENMEITHLQALKGRAILKRRPKGRWKAWKTQYVHIQAIAEEQSD